MKLKAIRNPAMVRGADGLLRLEMANAGREVILDPLAELIWDLSDGSHSLEDLARAAGRALDRVVHKEEVFSALDFLADAGLIEERVAPPVAEGKVSRRSLLVQIAPVVGAGACMMLGASARAGGLFQEGSSKEGSSKEGSSKEHSSKNNQMEANHKESTTKEGDGKADSDNRKEHNNKISADRHDSSNERIDHTGKYQVPPNHPLLGTWKCVKYYDWPQGRTTILWTIFADGITSYQFITNSGQSALQTNWKYTSTSHETGFIEEFRGERLSSRGDIRWISRNDFELTITYNPEHIEIGERRRYVRDPYWREGIRSETRSETDSNHNASQYQQSVRKTDRDLENSKTYSQEHYEGAAPRVIAQKLCDQLDQAYVNQDLNQVLGFYDWSYVLIDERGNHLTLAEFRRDTERGFAESRRMNPKTIVQKVELEGDRMVVHFKSEMHFEARSPFGHWIPMISEDAGEDTWQRKGDRWKIISSRFSRDDTYPDRNR